MWPWQELEMDGIVMEDHEEARLAAIETQGESEKVYAVFA